MKKDRDNMYPTYPMPCQGYQMPMTGMPISGMPVGGMPMTGMPTSMPMNNMSTFPDQGMMGYSDIVNQLNALEKRVSNLETIVSSPGNYKTSGYQMM